MARTFKILISLILLCAAAWFALRDTDYSLLLKSIARFDGSSLAVVAIAIALSSLIAALRLRAIAADYGYSLSVRNSVAALSLGQLGGALLFQIIGQLLARGSYLKQHNIPLAGTVLITVQERIAAAAVSFFLAVGGALFVFHKVTFNLVGGGSELVVLVFGLCVATASAAFIWRNTIRSVMSQITLQATLLFFRALILSLGVQAAMMAAYVYAGHVVAPGIGLTALASAAALVMFAASIPVSLAGWGVREMSAVAALGAIGMPADEALTIAILVGLLSIAIAALLALCSTRRVSLPTVQTSQPAKSRGLDGMLATVLPVLVAVLVFFQVHLPTKAGGLNVNLADPLALLGGVMFVLKSMRSGWPSWRVAHFGWMVLACTLAITFALLNGAWSIGWTQWALTNKYFGWFILIAYGATGALAVQAGVERVLATFVAVGCAIIVYCALLNLTGYVPPIEYGKFPGFAQNPNAFAFQCLMVLAAAFALPSRQIVPALIALVGIWLTGSRAGLGASLVVLFAAVVTAGRGKISYSTIAAAVAVCAAFIAVGLLIGTICDPGIVGTTAWCGAFGYARNIQLSSNSDHLLSSFSGVQMFLQHPVFGAGLGTFIHDSGRTGTPQAIHSTLIWLLAEFGAIGAAIFVWPIAAIAIGEIRRFRDNDNAGRLLLLVIAALATMSLAHELMYQRTFWFLLAAAIAVPYRKSSNR